MLKSAKKTLKRKLSYKLSFKSEAEMINAIRTLKSTNFGDGLDFDVSAVIDDSPVKVGGDEESIDNQAPQEIMSEMIVEDYDDDDFATGSKTSSFKVSNDGQALSEPKFDDSESISGPSSSHQSAAIEPAELEIQSEGPVDVIVEQPSVTKSEEPQPAE